MATYDRSEIITKTVRYSVPATLPYGAHPDEIAKAATAASNEAKEAGGLTLRFVPRDDEIAIEFDIECTDG
jgi:hypothetical protein